MWKFRSVYKGIGAGIGSTAAVALGIGWYGSHQINSKRQRWFSDKFVLTPENLRLPYKHVKFDTDDGVKLTGWFIEQTVQGKASDRIVLCFNPYNQDKSSLLGVARGFWDNGFSVMLFDFRSHTEDVVPQSIGYLERRDARAALDWLTKNKPDDARIGLVGASMGGAVALTIAAENPPEVVAVSTDCAFTCLKDVIGQKLDRMFPFLKFFDPGSQISLRALFLESICLVNRLWYGYDIAAVGPGKMLENIQVPLMVVHSEKDSTVPLQHGIQIYNGVSSQKKRLLVVKNAEHIGSYYMNQKEYISRQVDFLNQCFVECVEDENSIYIPDHQILSQLKEKTTKAAPKT